MASIMDELWVPVSVGLVLVVLLLVFNELWVPVSVGLVLVVLLLVFNAGAGKSKQKSRRLPPGPFPWPLFGNLFLGGSHPHQVFAALSKKQYGNIMSLFFGSVRVVVVSDASMAKELFTVQDAKFASRPVHDLLATPAKYLNCGEPNSSMAFSEYTAKTRELRQFCISEVFTPQKMEKRRGTRMEEIQRMFGQALHLSQQELPAAGPIEIDLRPILSEFSLRVNCRSLFNKAFSNSDGLQSSAALINPQAFRKLEMENTMLLATHNIVDVVPAFRILFGSMDVGGIHARWKDLSQRKVDCADSVLEFYRNQRNLSESDPDFVESLLHQIDDGKFSVPASRALLFGLLTAGTDTVAATLEWALLELVRHPQCLDRVHKEIDAKFGMSGPVEEDEAAQLPYLQAVLKEVLRLHAPTAMGIPHSNMEDATLGGYHIPARTTVFANFWALHRDPLTWGPDALAFNPDRFLGSNLSVNGTNHQFLPFGAGRRICPGRALAMRVLSQVLGCFVHAFHMSAPQGVKLNDNEGTNGLNLRPETPLRMQISLRPAAWLYLKSSA